jgi:hypothetical protein
VEPARQEGINNVVCKFRAIVNHITPDLNASATENLSQFPESSQKNSSGELIRQMKAFAETGPVILNED